MPADYGDKTEAPSPRRIEEARERGQVAKSADLSAAVGLLAGLILLNFYGPAMMQGFMDLLRQGLSLDQIPVKGPLLLDHSWRLVLRQTGMMMMPFMMVLVVVAIVVNLAQVGFVFTSHPLMPSFDKISPLAGFKRLFSLRTTIRMMMSLGKVGIVSVVAYITIKNDMAPLVSLTTLDFLQVVGLSTHMVFVLGLRLAAVLVILALIDMVYQKYQAHQDLRMSKEEVKEEMRRMEGDPMVRSRRRAIARHLASQRMSQAVPKADVVVTNPTELAIALKYDHANMPAPKVIARGAGYIAQRIREIANENGVPIVERKPLAQALYRTCNVGDFVPPDLYKAVAEILAYVFELAGKGFRHRSVG